MNKLALLVPLAIGTLGAVAPLSGCSSDKNHDQRNSPDAAAPKPDYNNLTLDELKLACLGPEAGRPWINGMPPQCTKDPGSRPVDQLKEQKGYTFAWVWNLNPLDTNPLNGPGRARATYTYDDNTALFVVPERDARSDGRVRLAAIPADAGWMPHGEVIPPVPGILFERAVRFRGGPFTEYGGGFGQSFRTASNSDSLTIDENGAAVTLPSSPEFSAPANGAYDLRSYTGIAIWVRRGPLGMSTLRVGITEKNSAEDLNSGAVALANADTMSADGAIIEGAPGIEENKHCRRWRLCGCAAGTPCTDGLCYDPAIGQTPEGALSCGAPKCRENNTSTTAIDPLFTAIDANGMPVDADGDGSVDAQCTAYQTSDGRTDMFCYDPARHAAPPAKRERCNNPFSRPITVTLDWELIKVPFKTLLQADEGHVADDFDLSAVKQIVVTHGGGWMDFWIGNVGFYKKL